MDIPRIYCCQGRPVLHRRLEAISQLDHLQPQGISYDPCRDGTCDELCHAGVGDSSSRLDRAREKLFLTSERQSTREEDIAYSLLGILDASIPVIYGEGNRPVGRLLEYVLAGMGDVTLLAWTGRTGDYNSCLPPNLTVYNQLVPPQVPQPIEAAEMDGIIMALHSSLPDLSLAMALHDHLLRQPSPLVALDFPASFFRSPTSIPWSWS